MRRNFRPAAAGFFAGILLLVPAGSEARELRYYFIGNSLSRGLTLASGQDRSRLEGLIAADGDRLVFGTQLGAGVNLDEHWVKRRLSTGAALQLTHMDDVGETGLSDGVTYAFSIFRDYQFALSGRRREPDGTISTGEPFDGVVLQPYQSLLEATDHSVADQAKGFRGDRAAIRDFIGYASGDGVTIPPNDPPWSSAVANTHRSSRRFYIYSAWARLEGIEGAAIDTDGDGVFSFSEFYSQRYSVPAGGLALQFISDLVPSRDYVSRLFNAVRADHPGEDIRLIPVGEVFAAVDARIRSGTLPGIAAYFNRNATYYLEARLDGKATLAEAGFDFLYWPGEPSNFGSDFVPAQGVKNFYCDPVHMNDQTHNDDRSGTIGAYLAAATVQAVLTGRPPARVGPADVATIYEKFDAVEDAALIRTLQETVWSVVTADPRTGVAAVSAGSTDYAGYRAARFSAAQQADAGISGESADPDGDNQPNIAEFFFQTDPLSGASKGEGTLAEDGKFAFTGVVRSAGLHPRWEYSSDLESWTSVDLNDLAPHSTSPDGMGAFGVSHPEPGTREFHRLAFSFRPSGPTLPLVRWGPGSDTVAASVNLTAGKEVTAIPLSSPASPSPGPGYQTSSPVFFAAASTDFAGNAVGTYRITNDSAGGPDTLTVSLSKGTAAELGGAVTVVWRQAGHGGSGGFLNGASAGNVQLASLQLRAKTNSSTTGLPQTRFIVRSGSQWLISADCGAVTGLTLFDTIRLSDLPGIDWFAWDPDQHAVIGSPMANPSFDQVTDVGFQWRVYATGSTQTLHMESFEAQFAP